MAFLAVRARSACRALAQQQQQLGSTAGIAREAFGQQPVASASQAAQQIRRFAAGGGEGVTYEGVTIHKASPAHKWVGKLMCATMWFWVFYRAYWDGETFLFGHAQHWEHELAHDKLKAAGGHGDEEAHH